MLSVSVAHRLLFVVRSKVEGKRFIRLGRDEGKAGKEKH
jgi:hypothetical protein